MLLLPFLAGCAAVPITPPRPAGADISRFALAGRLTVRQAETRHHVDIDWRHTPEGDRILLTTPFGQGVAELARDEVGARLMLADGRRFEADDWNELARKMFGVALPLEGATRWLLGDLSETGGWRVMIRERENDAAEGLPTLIELERDDIAVRFKIDEWLEVK
ncbi:MAG: lipoprotein insertase outer membrane protein LolB [Rhodocyclaceae bacterium]